MSPGCGPPDIEQVGGVIYVYELAPGEDGKVPGLDRQTQQTMVAALQNRLDPGGTQGIRVSFNEAGRVEIAVPGQDDSQQSRVQTLATSTGKLEFLILANPSDHADLIEKARAAKTNVIKDGNTVVGRWVDAVRQSKSGDLLFVGLGATDIVRDGQSGQWVEFTEEEIQRMNGRPHVQNQLLRETGLTDLEVLAVVDRDPDMNLQGKHLASVSESVDDVGHPCLDFAMTDRGARVLAAVTSSNLPDSTSGLRRRLGIIFDDQLISAPAIMGTIRQRGVITGNFTREEVQMLVAILRAGELPAKLNKQPVETREVKPREQEPAVN
jgi:SecD/SecF fusion protein